MPLWKKFLAACLVVFSTTLFSCETRINGEPEIQVQTQNLKSDQISEHIMLGGIGFSTTPDSIKAIKVLEETVGITAMEITNDTTINELKGDIVISEEDSASLKQACTINTGMKKGEVNLVTDTTYASFFQEKLKGNGPVTKDKTKNPPEADSINCNTIRNYY